MQEIFFSPVVFTLLYVFVSPTGAALSDTLLPAVHPGPSDRIDPSSYCSRSLRQQWRSNNMHPVFPVQGSVLGIARHYRSDTNRSLKNPNELASWASVYTDAPFRQTRPPARFAKPACLGHPQFPYDCQLCCQAERRFTPLVTITYNKKAGQGRSGIHPFLPCPLIATVTILSSAVWQLPVPFADHRRRTAPRSV